MVVIVRIDLDILTLEKVGELVKAKLIMITDASESKAFRDLSAYQQLLTVRDWKGECGCRKSA